MCDHVTMHILSKTSSAEFNTKSQLNSRDICLKHFWKLLANDKSVFLSAFSKLNPNIWINNKFDYNSRLRSNYQQMSRVSIKWWDAWHVSSEWQTRPFVTKRGNTVRALIARNTFTDNFRLSLADNWFSLREGTTYLSSTPIMIRNKIGVGPQLDYNYNRITITIEMRNKW